MIFGLENTGKGLPEGWIPLEAVAVVECLDQDGDVALYLARTDGMTDHKMLGMLHSGVVTTNDDVAKSFRCEGEEEDE